VLATVVTAPVWLVVCCQPLKLEAYKKMFYYTTQQQHIIIIIVVVVAVKYLSTVVQLFGAFNNIALPHGLTSITPLVGYHIMFE
jgi:hypothetical protein